MAQLNRLGLRRVGDLLGQPRAGLAAGGVSAYPFAQAWRDYRRAVLYNWVYVAVVAGTLDVSNERAFAWMSQMIARQSAASTDLGVFDD